MVNKAPMFMILANYLNPGRNPTPYKHLHQEVFERFQWFTICVYFFFEINYGPLLDMDIWT